MTNPVLLNNVEHKDLRVLTGRGAQFGDNVNLALTFPAEFRNLQAHYPLVLSKGADGVSFDAYALLGFEDGENLFLDGARWDATEIPLSIDRHPFLIGVAGEELMVHVDLDNPRVRQGGLEGEALFLAHGGSTDYLERANATLLAIHEGLQPMPAFVAALLEHKLLESFSVDIEMNDGSQNRLSGFYTIHEENLAKLGAEALGSLHARGYLQPIYMVIASMSKLRDLIERKNKRHAGPR